MTLRGNLDEHMVTETIGNRIRRLRLKQGIRFQKDLAKMISIDPASLNQIEQGYRVPKLATVDKLATALGVSRNVILDGEKAASAMPPRPYVAEPVAASEPQPTAKPPAPHANNAAELGPELHAIIRTTIQEEIRAAIADLGFAISHSVRPGQSKANTSRQGSRSNTNAG